MTYTAKDIETLSFRDAVRERVAMYMGSADNQGFGNSEERVCKLRELERPGNFLEKVGLEG